eukprot:c17040_g1_i2.p1 GENE.c17040_g1_i2~~c17040_g1_i2.p1  ORF type:complete len:352 (+),score=79.93 c17040_g1_i2:107-1057(+)
MGAHSFDLDEFLTKMINYTLMVTMISFLQIMLLIYQIDAAATQALAGRVSIVTVGAQAILDAYLFLIHLTAGIIREPLFNAFGAAALFKFIEFSIFEMRFLLMIWKASRPDAFSEGRAVMRRQLTLLYLKFYGCLLLGIAILYQLQSHIVWSTFVVYSYWVPQIIHTAKTDSQKPLSVQYVLGMGMSRLAIPLYFLLCPNNFFGLAPRPGVAIALISWTAVQITVVLGQHYWGPRSLLPAVGWPPRYNYKRWRREETRRLIHKEGDCAICMGQLNEADTQNTLITPCNHVFHQPCLEEWMNIKLECPICRSQIPPI